MGGAQVTLRAVRPFCLAIQIRLCPLTLAIQFDTDVTDTYTAVSDTPIDVTDTGGLSMGYTPRRERHPCPPTCPT